MLIVANVFYYKKRCQNKKTLKNVKKRGQNKKRKKRFSHLCGKWWSRAPAVWLLTVRTTYDLEENSGWTSGPALHWVCVRTKLATLSLLTLKSVLGRAPAIWSLIVRTTRVEHRQSGCWLWGQLCMKILQGRAPTVRLWLSRRQVIWVRTVELRTASSDSDSV